MTTDDAEPAEDDLLSLSLRQLTKCEPVLLDLHRSLTGLAGDKLQARVDEIPKPVLVYWRGSYKGDVTLLYAWELIRSGAHWNGCDKTSGPVAHWTETKCGCIATLERVDAKATAAYEALGKHLQASRHQ